jgi:hypothetical protein
VLQIIAWQLKCVESKVNANEKPVSEWCYFVRSMEIVELWGKATGRAWIGEWVAHTPFQARCRAKYPWHPALLVWDLHSATCNMVQVRNTAGGVRDSGEFKLLVGIVNKTWPLVPFIGTLAVICLMAVILRIFRHTSCLLEGPGDVAVHLRFVRLLSLRNPRCCWEFRSQVKACVLCFSF